MNRSWSGWLLILLLLIAMLLPIWLGEYAPLYDYPGHLLEAQVVIHYADPQFGYAASYEINPGWYLRSNALSTLLLTGLGHLMPMPLAGHLVLSLYIVLFVGGLGLLLRRAGTAWPLLLLAPPLAYNFAFTSGWLNFCYSLTLGLYVLVIYLHWQEQGRGRDLWLLALLLCLIYTAHLMVWALLLVMLAALAAGETYPWPRYGGLWLALNSALPLLLITRPVLAVIALLIAPLIWGSAALLRRLRLRPILVALSLGGLTGLAVGIAKISEPLYQAILPELEYYEFDKITFPLRLFTLPHQFMPPNTWLIGYNLVLLALILLLTGLLGWSTWSQPNRNRRYWLAPIGLLSFLYVLIPSRTPDVWITEPRVLLLIIFMALATISLPATDYLRRAVTICASLLCLWSLVGTTAYAYHYEQQTQTWRAQMAQLAPARTILLLREKRSAYIGRPTLLGSFNRFYTGEFFSMVYTLEHGGFASRTFNNGPIRPRPIIPIPFYDWPGFRDTYYVAEQCSALRESYDAVLFWGRPNPSVAAQLNDCFVAGPHWPDLAIWHNEIKPKASVAN